MSEQMSVLVRASILDILSGSSVAQPNALDAARGGKLTVVVRCVGCIAGKAASHENEDDGPTEPAREFVFHYLQRIVDMAQSQALQTPRGNEGHCANAGDQPGSA